MVLSWAFLSVMLWIVTGAPYPMHASGKAWFWLALSGLVGYVFGDWCLFNSYIVFGSRYGQLFMTLAPPMAGIAGWLMLGESMSWRSWLAMLVTLTGIAISILARGGESHKLTLKLPLKGVLFGIGAGVGQGVGLVLSKIGLEHYALSIPAEAPQAIAKMMPFAGTYIRAVAGFVGFFLILALTKQLHLVGKGLHDRKGMTFAVLTTFFGPFLGVSLSLMAVQYAKAGIASTLMALTPVLIIVPYALIHKQKISVKEVIGTLITMVGVALFFLL
jgi:drug/metabolite transporter (DMT)-like permease